MPSEDISIKLQNFLKKNEENSLFSKEIINTAPTNRFREQIRNEIHILEKNRVNILKNVSTFAGLDDNSLLFAVQRMTEITYMKGDIIIQQADIGDSFFILESGTCDVICKSNLRDPDEVPRKLNSLKSGSYFGEIALLTEEPRSASIIVTSEKAFCVKMTKKQFDELISSTQSSKMLSNLNSLQLIGANALDCIPLFKTLTPIIKKKLLEAMKPMKFLPYSYICRQGTPGNAFYILIEGSCKVTINSNDNEEREVAQLNPGDFFGEVALIEENNMRTANVISIEHVSCFTLGRNDFNNLLKSMKIKIMEHQALRSLGQGTGLTLQSTNGPTLESQKNRGRRISIYDPNGLRDELRAATFFKRFAKFSIESLWNSMYSRMYRDLLLDPSKLLESGKYAAYIMKVNNTRYLAVDALREEAIRILSLDSTRRDVAEHQFVFGLLSQRGILYNEYCADWDKTMFSHLCKKVKILRITPGRRLVELDSKGTMIYVILRGAVRIFGKAIGTGSSQTFFEKDLFPGEMFGEGAFKGITQRDFTAISLTNVDVAIFEHQDFILAQDVENEYAMTSEEKCKFLQGIDIFKSWDSYRLMRLAHVLNQEEIKRNSIITSKNEVCRDIYFVVNGKVDLLTDLKKKYVITTLTNGQYFGESGFLNKFTKAINNKVVENFYFFARTNLNVLVFQETHFNLFDLDSVDIVKRIFVQKRNWRFDRINEMKHERALVRKSYYIMHLEAEAMSIFQDKIDNNIEEILRESELQQYLELSPQQRIEYDNLKEQERIQKEEELNQFKMSLKKKKENQERFEVHQKYLKNKYLESIKSFYPKSNQEQIQNEEVYSILSPPNNDEQDNDYLDNLPPIEPITKINIDELNPKINIEKIIDEFDDQIKNSELNYENNIESPCDSDFRVKIGVNSTINFFNNISISPDNQEDHQHSLDNISFHPPEANMLNPFIKNIDDTESKQEFKLSGAFHQSKIPTFIDIPIKFDLENKIDNVKKDTGYITTQEIIIKQLISPEKKNDLLDVNTIPKLVADGYDRLMAISTSKTNKEILNTHTFLSYGGKPIHPNPKAVEITGLTNSTMINRVRSSSELHNRPFSASKSKSSPISRINSANNSRPSSASFNRPLSASEKRPSSANLNKISSSQNRPSSVNFNKISYSQNRPSSANNNRPSSSRIRPSSANPYSGHPSINIYESTTNKFSNIVDDKNIYNQNYLQPHLRSRPRSASSAGRICMSLNDSNIQYNYSNSQYSEINFVKPLKKHVELKSSNSNIEAYYFDSNLVENSKNISNPIENSIPLPNKKKKNMTNTHSKPKIVITNISNYILDPETLSFNDSFVENVHDSPSPTSLKANGTNNFPSKTRSKVEKALSDGRNFFS